MKSSEKRRNQCFHIDINTNNPEILWNIKLHFKEASDRDSDPFPQDYPVYRFSNILTPVYCEIHAFNTVLLNKKIIIVNLTRLYCYFWKKLLTFLSATFYYYNWMEWWDLFPLQTQYLTKYMEYHHKWGIYEVSKHLLLLARSWLWS